MRIGIIQTFMDYHRRGEVQAGPLQPGIGPLIAALLPPGEDIHIVHETLERPDWTREYDLLFISCLHSEFDRARMISHYWRRRGAKTVLGGVFASTYSRLSKPYFDSIAIGDAESTVRHIYADFKTGTLKPFYLGSAYSSENMPAPRFDLIGPKQTVPLTFEVSRGCPFQCDFCALTALGTRYHTRPMDKLIRDVETGRRLLKGQVPDWKLRIAMLLDNNVGGSQTWMRELCLTTESLELFWAAAITFNVVSSEENVRMLARGGARLLFTGIESFNPETIEDMNKKQNTLNDTRRVIDLCHANGIALISPLLLNAEKDSIEYIRSIPDRLSESGLIVPAFVAFESPFPGTPLFNRMAAAAVPAFLPNARLADFNGYTLVLRTRRASEEKFVEAYRDVLARVTSPQLKLRQILANAPGFLKNGHYASALVDSLLHWSAVFRRPLRKRTYITGSDVPFPELTDVPFRDSDFANKAERDSILCPWQVTDAEGRVMPQWLHPEKVFGVKGLVNPELAARAG